jgi:hypothetical protein
VIPTLIATPIGDPGEPPQQVSAPDRGIGQTSVAVWIGHDSIDR